MTADRTGLSASSPQRLDGARVLVLGLGASGLAMAAWCARQGAGVLAWDTRLGSAAGEALAQALADRVPSAALLPPGAPDGSALDTVDRIFKSPGLAPGDAAIAPLLAAAAARGIVVAGELDLFTEALAGLQAERGYAPRLLAVTGTNGKTTTTALTALLVERAGRRVAMAGNIGPTLLGTLTAALDSAAPLPDVWVLELSSFQLHDAHGFEPDAAVVLNITQDHLDWHGTLQAYADDKARIFGGRTLRVVNRDDPAVERMATDAAVSAASGRRKAAAVPAVVRFGLDVPRNAGDFGLVVEQGMAWLVRRPPAEAATRRDGPAAAPPLQRLMPAAALRMRGRHNAANALAALALATAIGCPLAPMLHGLREYRGEPHRVAFVATIDGVDYFDDSKGTNVGATVAALDGLGADRAPASKLLVILGGDGKGQDFGALAAPVARHARAAALIGRDAAAIAEALAGTPATLARCADLAAAVRWAAAQARAGDAVLLSPACASFDMFRDYAHRADVFVAEVLSLATEQRVIA